MNVKNYLDKSYTCFHAVALSREYLEKNGFIPYKNGVKAVEGGKYYVEKNGSALVAFTVGDLSNYSFKIALAHTDSPALKVKGAKLLDSPEGKRINVEVYGGLIRYSFMNIPLKIAGRLFVKTNQGVKTVLVESDFNVNIPSLCIHHNPDVNEKANLSVQNDMLPLIGGTEDDLYKILLPNEEVLDGDLFVVPDVKAYSTGVDGKLLSSPRIDNLTSCYGMLSAITGANVNGVSVCALFDNEEIGSRTKQGAFSDLLPSILKRINSDLGKNYDDYLQAIDNGLVLSIDNGHAVHPAHPEKSDPAQKVYLNGGVVVKRHVNYSTDGYSAAVFKAIMDNNGVKYQDYYNNSDVRCGGTLGLIVSTNLQMDAIDIGLSQLAMHSSIETVGVEDIDALIKCVKAFYGAKLMKNGDETTIN